jgi:sulfur-carrier protein
VIDVHLYTGLASIAASRRSQFEVPAEAGLTVRKLLAREGLPEDVVHLIVINARHATLETELQDGDRLGLFPPVGGG